MGLKGKVALVTGAARGIGLGCAIELAKSGCNVVLNDLDGLEEAEQVIAEIGETVGRTLAVQADVSSRRAVKQMVDATIARFGRLDLLVANAALSVRKPFLALTPRDVARVWGVTQWGVFHCSQFAARRMVEQGEGGAIVLIGSIHSDTPYKGAFPYTVAKTAIVQAARVMANELAPYGIRVNVVEPGWTDTPGEREYATEENMKDQAKQIPLQRLATPEDIDRGVVFLLSETGSYITGATLRIDGGFTLPQRDLTEWAEEARRKQERKADR